MLNLDLKKIEPKGRIKDRDSALLFFQQWRAYTTAGGTKSLRLLLENPTNPQDPLSTNLAGLGLHLSADPDKLQGSIYLEVMAEMAVVKATVMLAKKKQLMSHRVAKCV